MAIFTSEEIELQITAWKSALMAVSTGQAYDVGGRRLTRADLPEIRKTLEWLNAEKDKLDQGTGLHINVGRPLR